MAYKDCPCVNCDHKADGEKKEVILSCYMKGAVD